MTNRDLINILQQSAHDGAPVDLEIVTGDGVIRASLVSVHVVLVRTSPNVGAEVRTALRLCGARDI